MFKVEKEGSRYKISIGNGRPVRSDDLDGVARALQHYFRADLFVDVMGKWDYKAHIAHAKECGCCPLCSN